MLFDSSEHCIVMLFSAKSEIVITCNLTMCVWACSSDFWRYLSVHVLLCFTCTSCPCLLLSCWGAVACCFGACNMPSCCFGQIVIITCFMCVLNRCSVLSVLYMKLAWFACIFILSCCIHVLSVFGWRLNAFCINAMFNLFCSYLLGRSSKSNELYM